EGRGKGAGGRGGPVGPRPAPGGPRGPPPAEGPGGGQPQAASRQPGGEVGPAGVHPGLAGELPRPLRPHGAVAVHGVGQRQEGGRAVRPPGRPARVEEPRRRPDVRGGGEGAARPGPEDLARRVVLEPRRAGQEEEGVSGGGYFLTAGSRLSNCGSPGFSPFRWAATTALTFASTFG